MKRTTQLSKLIKDPGLQFLMEAHNGVSARIVEEAGFKAIWGSGLSISGSLGVRDSNEASWTQVLETVEFMADASNIPILLDGDTGYGNFNNVRRLVRKLEQRDVAGVCLEDKLFPKTNSFIKGESQRLADIDEFSGKIKAAKDAQTDDDFVVVARVEAFIAGWGLNEALKRAEAYRVAGADAILVHSKRADCKDIDEFMEVWAGRHPVVIVPTTYYTTPTEHFEQLGISSVIWANHNIRASISAMQSVSKSIATCAHVREIDDAIVPVAEIFRLQGDDELRKAEKRYLPKGTDGANAIILAASQGERFGELTETLPKTMLSVGGRTILERQLGNFRNFNIRESYVVRGFGKESVTGPGVVPVDNESYESTTELWSLYLARHAFRKNTVVSYGDIVFKKHILHELLSDDGDITILVDADYRLGDDRFEYVSASRPYSSEVFFRAVTMDRIDPELATDSVDGEFVGLWRVSEKGAAVVTEELERLSSLPNFKSLRLTDFFTEVQKKCPISIRYIRGSWVDVDSIVSLRMADGMANA